MASLMAVRAVRAALNNNAGSLSMTNTYATKSGVTKQKKSTTGSGKSGSPPPQAMPSPPSPSTKNVDPPAIIFKQPAGSVIGPGADKAKEYKNPEYFLYHNYSFADMDECMAKFRLPQPSSLKK